MYVLSNKLIETTLPEGKNLEEIIKKTYLKAKKNENYSII